MTINRKGKICLVTGGNSGIGFETAKELSLRGSKVILLCRSADKAEKARKEITALHPEAEIDLAIADLSSQKQVRTVAQEILEQYPKIDVLVNNAGAWFSEFGRTEDGFERQWAINHLAPFLLTHLLLPALLEAKDPRIINISSDSHFHGKIHFDDVNLSKKYHGLRAYAQSKLANVLFTHEFEVRKPVEKLSVYAVQPGLVKTDIGLKHTVSFHGLMWKLRRLVGKSARKGAETSIYLASSGEVRGISGKYWDNCHIKSPSYTADSPVAAARLWDLSMEMCGISKYFP
ncbi:NAD(P)-dependent dehydrogenase, short-chain alcohol dehydrogenase family [Cyclobacterium lianum]|uniref:NAD(P)-dependent dehydrogenase, short-chain alcohol dehydrogenase family n=1 Tax=Cyclobacterium lianum TaxID=388280 RepID=A0A1M7M195_9BACT|nr:SDR family oxidoreductase [Cyclobacterium lianum]SHM84422.1 NAD(P)-dependent dehydrogenase, short-chain alcohol dehydrogenase family [Cyclobacterium lianum]